MLVNQQPIYRAGLRWAIESGGGFLVVGEAASGYRALQEADRCRPDLVIVDADLPGISGFAVVSALSHGNPSRSAVVVAEDVDRMVYDRAIACGAAGAVPARIGRDQLVRVLRRVAQSRPVLWEPEAAPAHRRKPGSMAPPGLTMREIEVLDCVAQGFSNRQIAEALFVNEQTVKNHMTSIFRKLGVDDRVQALILSIKRGWVDFGSIS